MTQNRRKRGFNDGTEDRSVAPYFQWKLKYGAIALRAQRAQPKSSMAAFRLKTRAPSPSLCSVGRREGSPRRGKFHIPCFPASGKASSFHCRSLPNQSKCFDLERKNGGADTEPSRLSAAAAWSKPILTMAREASVTLARESFSAAHVAGKSNWNLFATKSRTLRSNM